ncbi:Uncharacterised protein [Cedecea neteri]|uniref:Uncharacterized protein n=1 Tax=Cedecea neteri TaxID=158822 RepID=A0A2X3KVT9_9ENTR|nr:Uncharacterised protein [Cedecea neteri]
MTSKKMVSLVNGVLIVAVLLPVLLSIYLAHNKAEKTFHSGAGKLRRPRVTAQRQSD